MKLKLYEDTYQITRLPFNSEIPAGIYNGEFYSIGKTDDELSIICTDEISFTCEESDNDWRIFKFVESMDLNLIGIAAKITSVLANANVNIMVVSTYNTDFVMVKNDKLEIAVNALKSAGYEFV